MRSIVDNSTIEQTEDVLNGGDFGWVKNFLAYQARFITSCFIQYMLCHSSPVHILSYAKSNIFHVQTKCTAVFLKP